MRRRLGLSIACAALLFVASTAEAGLRAVYIDVDKSKKLQIDVYDNGDARIGEVGATGYGLWIGGEFYVVDTVDGKPIVARLKDVATAIDKVMPPIFKGLFDNPAAMPPTHLTVQAGEFAEAGGRRGQMYRIKGLDSSQPDKGTDYLISDDPELKPVGAALEQFMNAGVVPAAPLIGAGAAELIAETRTIFSLGTPIDVGGRFRLNLAGKASFPAAYFRLPAAPLTVDQLVTEMKASMVKGPEAAAVPK